MQVMAVDWSGRAKGASASIWLAVASDGGLVRLENGRDRDAAIEAVIASSATIVGLDFAFSFPAWWLRASGWASGPEVWAAMRRDGEALLAACAPPFWGRPGTRAQILGPPLRATDTDGAKSVFQISGAGAVGTGSIRGMPHLLRLAEAGFAIWPFEPAGERTVVEIYPRRLTGPVIKRRASARRAYLEEHVAAGPLVERAASSEDAFDAAVSALVMARHLRAPDALGEPPEGPVARLEGSIWTPPGTPPACTSAHSEAKA